jgi:predicted metal-binding protein
MRMMIKVLVRTLAYRLVLPMLITVAATFTAAAAEPGYAGWKTCAVCHRTVSANWQKSRHAQAYESLTKSKQGDLPGCVRCHVTGYEKEGGFIDYELTPELAGIQCEECHGPGSTHLKSMNKSDIRSAPDINSCRRCHTQGQDPGFDYQKKVQNVHGPQGNAK